MGTVILESLISGDAPVDQIRQEFETASKKLIETNDHHELLQCCTILCDYLLKSPDGELQNELLSVLRLASASSKTLRNALALSDVNGRVWSLVFQTVSIQDDCQLLGRRRFLQYLGNVVSDCDDASEIEHLIEDQFPDFMQLLEDKDIKTSTYARFTLYNLCRVGSAFFSGHFVDIVCISAQTVLDRECEWALLLIELIISQPDLADHFDGISFLEQCVLLDFMSEKVSQKPPIDVNPKIVQTIVDKVKSRLQELRKEYTARDRNQEILFVKMVTSLAIFSLLDKYQLKNDLELLVMVIECLHTVHQFGKNNVEGFDAKSDYQSLVGERDEVSDHPLFGLKRDLVRLIGNLTHEHKLNQDTVRDFNGLELLCDMSSLDGRNPYITEWVVFALRNLLANNPENQEIVSKFVKRDTNQQTSPLLREFELNKK